MAFYRIKETLTSDLNHTWSDINNPHSIVKARALAVKIMSKHRLMGVMIIFDNKKPVEIIYRDGSHVKW